MRQALTAAGALILAGTINADAALPPQYQRSRELVAVIEAATHALAHPIDRIEHQDGYTYRVEAGPCFVIATIVPQPTPPDLVGPMAFTVALGSPACAR